MGKRVFNLDNRTKLEQYIKKGFTTNEIAQILDISPDAIFSEIKRNGGKRRFYNAQKAQEMANEKMGKNSLRMKTIMKRDDSERNKELEEENQILKMQIEILEEQLKGA